MAKATETIKTQQVEACEMEITQRPFPLSADLWEKLNWLVALIWMLPKRLRYRFFSHFHAELRQFFSQERRQRVSDKASVSLQILLSGELWLQGETLHPIIRWVGTISVSAGERTINAELELRRSPNGRVSVSVLNGETVVNALVTAVKQMPPNEQNWLWAFLDEALLDYEDYLIATDSELKRELGERLREETVSFEELWQEILREREETRCRSGD
jgi:hypothetical protein